MEEVVGTDNYSCLDHEKCKVECKRKSNWKRQDWFSGWLNGEPEREDCCIYIQKNKQYSFLNKLIKT